MRFYSTAPNLLVSNKYIQVTREKTLNEELARIEEDKTASTKSQVMPFSWQSDDMTKVEFMPTA